jgi:predicted aminopeptidase
MILTALIAVAVVIVGAVTYLAYRDRGRDRSSADVPPRDDWDVASSSGVAGYRHEQGGPGA